MDYIETFIIFNFKLYLMKFNFKVCEYESHDFFKITPMAISVEKNTWRLLFKNY